MKDVFISYSRKNGKVTFAVDTARGIKGGFDSRHGHIDLL